MKYLQFANSLEAAKNGAHQIPEVLLINNGSESNLLFSYRDTLRTDLNRVIFVDGDTIPEAYFFISCLAAGTKITMADGTLKNIEDIVENDNVLAFNHEKGKLETSAICIAYKGEGQRKPLVLHFTNNKSLSIVGIHSILEQSSMKYVAIHENNVSKYVGKKFYNATDKKWETLLSFEVGEDAIDYYSVYSMQINCITNDFLTCPDDEDWALNVYELNSKLKANATQLAADIAKYGLLNVEEKCPEHPEKWEVIRAMAKYTYIAVGKGITTLEFIRNLYKFWK